MNSLFFSLYVLDSASADGLAAFRTGWHADDSSIFTFLGTFGKTILNVALVILALGLLRLVWMYRSTFLSKIRSPNHGTIALPFHAQDSESSVLSRPSSRSESRPASPTSSSGGRRPSLPASALGQRGALYFLPLWFPTSPSSNAEQSTDAPPPAYGLPEPSTSNGWSTYFAPSTAAQSRYVAVPADSDTDAMSLHSIKR